MRVINDLQTPYSALFLWILCKTAKNAWKTWKSFVKTGFVMVPLKLDSNANCKLLFPLF